MTEPVTQSTFDEEVVASERPVLVDFYADWCGPCQMIAPIVDALSTELGDVVDVRKVDVDRNQELATSYGVRSIPTLMLFKDGEPVETLVGMTTKENLKSTVERHV